jgi:hypothetical protein
VNWYNKTTASENAQGHSKPSNGGEQVLFFEQAAKEFQLLLREGPRLKGGY